MSTDTLPDLSTEFGAGPPPAGGRRTLLLVGLATVGTAVLTIVLMSMLQGGPAADADEDVAPHVFDSVEVEIGSFNCSNNQADGSVVHISFRLFATIAEGQQTGFKDIVQNRMNARVRQAVGKVIRSSSMEDLDDPDQGVIRRQLKEEINKVLRKSFINEVILVDFRMLQQ
jgi:hypothetical protein